MRASPTWNRCAARALSTSALKVQISAPRSRSSPSSRGRWRAFCACIQRVGRGDHPLGRGLHRPRGRGAVVVGQEALDRGLGRGGAEPAGADPVGQRERDPLGHAVAALGLERAVEVLVLGLAPRPSSSWPSEISSRSGRSGERRSGPLRTASPAARLTPRGSARRPPWPRPCGSGWCGCGWRRASGR